MHSRAQHLLKILCEKHPEMQEASQLLLQSTSSSSSVSTFPYYPQSSTADSCRLTRSPGLRQILSPCLIVSTLSSLHPTLASQANPTKNSPAAPFPLQRLSFPGDGNCSIRYEMDGGLRLSVYLALPSNDSQPPLYFVNHITVLLSIFRRSVHAGRSVREATNVHCSEQQMLPVVRVRHKR